MSSQFRVQVWRIDEWLLAHHPTQSHWVQYCRPLALSTREDKEITLFFNLHKKGEGGRANTQLREFCLFCCPLPSPHLDPNLLPHIFYILTLVDESLCSIREKKTSSFWGDTFQPQEIGKKKGLLTPSVSPPCKLYSLFFWVLALPFVIAVNTCFCGAGWIVWMKLISISLCLQSCSTCLHWFCARENVDEMEFEKEEKEDPCQTIEKWILYSTTLWEDRLVLFLFFLVD